MFKKSLILCACLFLYGCQSGQETAPAEKPPIPVIAAPPVVKDIPVYVESIGTLSPSISMEIHPQVIGTLSQVYINEGQWVQKGALLMEIDPKPYAIKVREAEAQLEIKRVELQAAEKKLERFKKLAQKDLVPQIEWDEIETQAARAQAMLELDEARLNAAELDLEHCTLLSPIEGRVGKLDAHPGLLITGSSSPLATISRMDPLTIEFAVTESELSKLPKENLEIELQTLCLGTSDEGCTKGQVTFLDNHFDQKTGQLLVRGKVSNPDFSFRPGQTIRVKVPIATSPDRLLIPQKAVRYNEQGTYIYVVDAEKSVVFRQVSLGEEHGSDVIVLEGLDAGEIVISDGHLRASPGIKVDVQS